MPNTPHVREGSILIDRLLTLPQYLIPHHALSRLVGTLTRLRSPMVRDLMIRTFIRHYDVDLSEAASSDPAAYGDFNAFFTRALAENARPLPGEPDAIACPVDGTISQIGSLQAPTLIQSKGKTYTAVALLGGRADLADDFAGGLFTTLYLAPHNYHRTHMPVDGRLTEVIYVPGALFSVNDRASRMIDGLFIRNERVISIFDTEAGRAGVIMVGAMFVGSMELTVCDIGTVGLQKVRGGARSVPIGSHTRTFRRGEELGRFNMGSTVILLFERDAGRWLTDLAPGDPVLMGQKIGVIEPRTS